MKCLEALLRNDLSKEQKNKLCLVAAKDRVEIMIHHFSYFTQCAASAKHSTKDLIEELQSKSTFKKCSYVIFHHPMLASKSFLDFKERIAAAERLQKASKYLAKSISESCRSKGLNLMPRVETMIDAKEDLIAFK